jgi:protein-S-isoprenylcysteine O-methyltransferase Ste14
MKTMFLISAAICFGCFMLRTAFNISKYRKRKWTENRYVIKGVLIAMFFLWASWFQMVFYDPVKMNIPDWARYIGLVVFIIGVFLFILSHINLKGFENKEHLVTGGVYSKIRNPMYLGFTLWIIGFPIFMNAFITLASGIIWIPCLMYWKILEEKELEEKYDEYKEYKNKTWF